MRELEMETETGRGSFLKRMPSEDLRIMKISKEE